MSDSSADELRLRVTEAQMRRALGPRDQASLASEPRPPSAPGGRAHAHRRHFVRDGEVPVSVVHHDDGGGTNKLDAARQALREQIAAREQVEQLLQEARATIQTLETELEHERIAREERVTRIERQLEEGRAARLQVEQERDEAIASCREAENRLREMMAVQEAQKPARQEGWRNHRPLGCRGVAGERGRFPWLAERHADQQPNEDRQNTRAPRVRLVPLNCDACMWTHRPGEVVLHR
jgi:hypothetical protein